MITTIIVAVIAFSLGYFVASILAIASSADDLQSSDYEPMEHEPPSRVMPRIWDRYNGKEHL